MRNILLLLCLFGLSVAEMKLYNENGFYPYVLHEPEGGLAKPWPMVMFLHGSGSRADSDFLSHAQWDGVGWLLGRWNRGVRGDAETIAAQKFFSLLPVARVSKGMDWNNNELMNVINQVKAKYGNDIDWNRFYVSGFSMGSFGTWRFITGNSDMVAAALPSAGYLTDGDINKVAKLPIDYFCSDSDDKVPGPKCQTTYDRLVSIGNRVSNFTRYPSSMNIPHSNSGVRDMSTVPFTADALRWLLSHSKGNSNGSSSSSGSSTSGSSTSGSSTTGSSTSGTTTGSTSGTTTGSTSGTTSGTSGGQGNKNDWDFCSSNSECRNGCCSKQWSGDGRLKCTPGGTQCVSGGNGNKGDWVYCSTSSECTNRCCSKKWSNDGRL
ncbi:Phospholipase/Carboxylesterase, partial [Planoprotostelium fungivorum]